jgi:hypothetical protein|nr:MAG TPA: SOS-response transcriptional repressor [Caudoviricetes sp.]DAS49683.1 MAG TPA: SOS-response transcriptional repressor [Caudoviricetes sp.]
MKGEQKKMTLRGYYESLPDATCPKTDFINEIASRTGVTSSTVRNWIFYGMKPANENHIGVLVEVTGIPADKLWAED